MNTAMILAAGRGERLRPLTDHIPKALCIVHGTPLVEYHVLHLAKAGFEKIIINHAYLGDQIRRHLGNGSRFGIEIYYAPEPPGGLETGGGIVNALPLLGSKPFLTVNADVYTNFDFKPLKLIDDVPYIHLVLVNNNPTLKHYGDFGLDPDDKVISTHLHYTFSGIACYNPKIMLGQQPGRYSVTPLIRRYVAERKVTGELYQGSWFDIGSLQKLNEANKWSP